jgi:hypothetical protein
MVSLYGIVVVSEFVSYLPNRGRLVHGAKREVIGLKDWVNLKGLVTRKSPELNLVERTELGQFA